MRTQRRRLMLSAAILVALGLIAPMSAMAATVADLVALATAAPHLMVCSQDGPAWYCNAPANRFHPSWFAKITPGSGQEDTLDTNVSTGQLPLDATSRSWMIDMHVKACGGPKGAVDAFVNLIGNLTKTGTAGPTVSGTCTFDG